MEYQINYEYKKNGRHWKTYLCTVFSSYKEADEVLCDTLSDLEAQGCTEVQGSVVEL